MIVDYTPTKLVRFNPRRAARGVGAAEIEIGFEPHTVRLWMTSADVTENLSELGPLPGLLDAQAAYHRNEPYRAD